MQEASELLGRRPGSRPAGGHRRRWRRGPGAVDPSGLAGEHLVEPVDLDHSCRWPSAPAAPRTWCRGSVRRGRRAAGGARRPRSLLQVAIGAGGAEDLVPRIRPARPASSWWSTSTSITSRGWPPAPAAPSTWCRRFVRHGRRAVGGAVDLDHAQGMAIGAGGAVDLVY